MNSHERLAVVETKVVSIEEGVKRIERKFDTHVATHRNGHTNGSALSNSEDLVIVVPKAMIGKWFWAVVSAFGTVLLTAIAVAIKVFLL